MAWYAGGDMLYGFFCTDAAGLETQSALLAMELDGGTPQQVPVSPGTKVLGTWNGLFVCSRTVPPAAVARSCGPARWKRPTARPSTTPRAQRIF